jgi:hypothetical protein
VGLVLTVAVVAALMAGALPEHEAGEEDDRDDEHDPGDHGDPRRGQKDLGGPAGRLFDDGGRWCCRGCCPRSWGFRSFTHETDDAWVNSSGGYALLKYKL